MREEKRQLEHGGAACLAGLAVGAQGVHKQEQKRLVGRPMYSSRSGLLAGVEIKA